MREILFKAKRIDNGEWVNGQDVYFENPKTESGEPVKHFIGNGTTIFTDEIDLSTLCQYTGLKDGNGKRIWENDIVLLREEIQNYEWKATVKFGNPNCESNWGWQLVPIEECDMNKDIILCIDMEIANCEVIGNIFDDPELLGQLINEYLMEES